MNLYFYLGDTLFITNKQYIYRVIWDYRKYLIFLKQMILYFLLNKMQLAKHYKLWFLFCFVRSGTDAFASLFKLSKLVSDESGLVNLMDIDLLTYFALIQLAKHKHELESINDSHLEHIYEMIKTAGRKLALKESVERRYYKLNDHLDMAHILSNHLFEDVSSHLMLVLNFMDITEFFFKFAI